MEFWALDNASKETVIMFGIAFLFFFVVGGTITLVDFIKKRKRKK